MQHSHVISISPHCVYNPILYDGLQFDGLPVLQQGRFNNESVMLIFVFLFSDTLLTEL